MKKAAPVEKTMKLIAWDTSSKAGALVALEWQPQDQVSWNDVRIVAELAIQVDATHSERLLWSIDQLLQCARWSLREVDAFGVGIGPGSFTGLRIGITTARTLAHSLKKPVVPVSSLAALVRPVALMYSDLSSVSFPVDSQPALVPSQSPTHPPIWIVAATDACKGELFCIYGKAHDLLQSVVHPQESWVGLWQRDVFERVMTPAGLMTELRQSMAQSETSRWVAVGEGRSRYLDEWASLPQNRESKVNWIGSDRVQGKYLGQLVWEAFQKGIQQEALFLRPRYLRDSDAEVKLRQKMQGTLEDSLMRGLANRG